MDAYRSPLRPDANAGLVALVSGGGTGIGRATALELSRSGAAGATTRFGGSGARSRRGAASASTSPRTCVSPTRSNA